MRVAIALTFALALAGCGGSGGGAQSEGEPPATETRAGQSLTVAGCPIDEAVFCERAAQAGNADPVEEMACGNVQPWDA